MKTPSQTPKGETCNQPQTSTDPSSLKNRSFATTLSPKKSPNINSKQQRKKLSSKIRHRLCSIVHDVEYRLKPLLTAFDSCDCDSNTGHRCCSIPLVANQRCGVWYTLPFVQANHNNDHNNIDNNNGDDDDDERSNSNSNRHASQTPFHSCYFKSTDGHVGSWKFSLKRLNLHLIDILASSEHQHPRFPGMAILVDASVRKALPDSFSRTLPIWAAVMNRLVLKYDKQKDTSWDTALHIPNQVVSDEERLQMEHILDQRVDDVYSSGAIIDPVKLVQTLRKPIRCVWWLPDDTTTNATTNAATTTTTTIMGSHGSSTDDNEYVHKLQNELQTLCKEFYILLCMNPSNVNDKFQWKSNNATASTTATANQPFVYLPGAADDHESWCIRDATAHMFWNYKNEILLDSVNSSVMLSGSGDDINVNPTEDGNTNSHRMDLVDIQDAAVEQRLTNIVRRVRDSQDPDGIHLSMTATATETAAATSQSNNWNSLGRTNLAIGSRRAGRPPQCWDDFCAVLNVTTVEYDAMQASNVGKDKSNFYLQLPVEEGKRDKLELEKWLSVGIVFCITHLLKTRFGVVSENERQGGDVVNESTKGVLIHCAQGKDRSVAVAMAVIVLFAKLDRFPLSWDWNLMESVAKNWTEVKNDEARDADFLHETSSQEQTHDGIFRHSGLPHNLCERLMGREGRDLLLGWVRTTMTKVEETDNSTIPNHEQRQQSATDLHNSGDECLASKEKLRIVLHWIGQDREQAEPTRSTLQKLNRYFMSQIYESGK